MFVEEILQLLSYFIFDIFRAHTLLSSVHWKTKNSEEKVWIVYEIAQRKKCPPKTILQKVIHCIFSLKKVTTSGRDRRAINERAQHQL